MNCINHRVEEIDSEGIRIDQYISDKIIHCTRSQVKSRVKKALVNEKEVKLSKKVHTGDLIEVSYEDPPPLDLIPEKMDLAVIFENDRIIALDKPQGIVVHPGSGNITHTLLNGIIWYCKEIEKNFPDSPLRPGIVHRLDKETSGVILVAKNPESLEFLGNQFRKRRVNKKYLAIVKGTLPEQEGIIDTLMQRDPRNRKRFIASTGKGKRAITQYRLVRAYGGYSLVLLKPQTGRTHQLRVHMKHINCPILGDDLYFRQDPHFPDARLMLHAFSISFRIPFEREKTTLKSPIPGRFRSTLRKLRLISGA
jgi:23S rRNA pseudouridine1911/1915/1917 synthase